MKKVLEEQLERARINKKFFFDKLAEMEDLQGHDIYSIYEDSFKSACEVEKYCEERLNNKVGRPSQGETKKVSITLPEEQWKTIESSGNFESYSAFFRGLVSDWLVFEDLESEVE